jgi:hypothetical protein
MGLNKYRPFKDEFHDNGLEKRVTVPADFVPDFFNRNTIQVWDVSSVSSVQVRKWKGITLNDRSLHEITIVNNNNAAKSVKFSSSYSLPDSDSIDEQEVLLGPQGSAHFYCTASLVENNLVFTMRNGSQDKRNI